MFSRWCYLANISNFINGNIGVLSGRLLLLEGVNKTFIVWVELSSVILRNHCVYFYVRVFIVYDYSSSGQAILYKSIARVKGDVSVN